MDDNEARYVIDQFNKYASWNVGRWISMLPYLAIVMAVFAISFSLPETDWNVPFLSNPTIGLLVPLGTILLVIGVTMGVGWKYNQDSRSLSRRLFILEDHRSRFKSLPDEVTFTRVVESVGEPATEGRIVEAEDSSALVTSRLCTG